MAPHRARFSPICCGILYFISVPNDQRSDLRPSHLRYRDRYCRPCVAHVCLFPRLRGGSIPRRYLVGPLWSAPRPECIALGRRRGRRTIRDVRRVSIAFGCASHDRPWGGGGADGWTEVHRSVVSEGTS